MSWPLKNNWKFRWRSARHATCQRDAGEDATATACATLF
jgi:hypothetical protein